MTIKKTSAVTQSVANTAKRVIVIVGVAIVMGESLEPPQAGGLRHRHRRRLPLLGHRPSLSEGRSGAPRARGAAAAISSHAATA